jgi:hypothetical protein
MLGGPGMLRFLALFAAVATVTLFAFHAPQGNARITTALRRAVALPFYVLSLLIDCLRFVLDKLLNFLSVWIERLADFIANERH